MRIKICDFDYILIFFSLAQFIRSENTIATVKIQRYDEKAL